MLQILTVQPKAFLNATSKAVDHTLTFPLGIGLNLGGDVCFESSYGAWVILIDVVLEEPPQEEIWEIQIRRVRWRFHYSFAANETVPKPFAESGHHDISSLGNSTI